MPEFKAHVIAGQNCTMISDSPALDQSGVPSRGAAATGGLYDSTDGVPKVTLRRWGAAAAVAIVNCCP
jgi:hypothetical protein